MNSLKIALAGAGLLVSMPAQATVFLFEFTGDVSFNFALAADQTPSFSDSTRSFFTTPGVFNGNSLNLTVLFVDFSGATGVGLFDSLLAPAIFSGSVAQRLYTGPTTAPVFTPGVYMLEANGPAPGTGMLTISFKDDTLIVPEPGSWAMLIAGFGLVGAVMRQRRRALA